MLSARELNSQSLPSRTWINEHLTFTHGYGLTLGPVNEVTSRSPRCSSFGIFHSSRRSIST